MTPDQTLNIITLLVLLPVFVAASVGAFFLLAIGRFGPLIAWASASTAVATPIFAFTWRSGTPFLEAAGLALVGGPALVTGFLLTMWLRDDPIEAITTIVKWPFKTLRELGRPKPPPLDF